MKMLRTIRRPIASVLAFAMLLVSAPIIPARAAIVGTDEIVSSATSARATVDAFLAREDVRAEMKRLGVSPDEAAARVRSLSDEEVERIAGRIDELPAGGLLVEIVGAILIVVLILILTDLLGLTSVYGFTNKGSLRR